MNDNNIIQEKREKRINFYLNHYLIFLLIIVGVISLLILIYTEQIELFSFDPSENGWGHFVNIFKVPLSIIGISIPIYGILVALSKLFQTEKLFKLNKQAFESTYRPFLTTIELLHVTESNHSLSIYFTTKNFGQFPAKITKVQWILFKDENEIDHPIELKNLYIILPTEGKRISTTSSKNIFNENYFYNGKIEIKSIIHYQGLNNSSYKTEMKHIFNVDTKKYDLIECNWY